MIRVANVDLHCENSRKAGATVLTEPTSQPYGERQYCVADLVGRVWTFTQSESNVDPTSWGGVLVQDGGHHSIVGGFG